MRPRLWTRSRTQTSRWTILFMLIRPKNGLETVAETRLPVGNFRVFEGLWKMPDLSTNFINLCFVSSTNYYYFYTLVLLLLGSSLSKPKAALCTCAAVSSNSRRCSR